MSTYLTKGIVLRVDKHGDYDRRYLIYTEDFGKLTAIAKSGSKTVSKIASHLSYPAVVNLMLAHGAVFERIASAMVIEGYRGIIDNSLKSAAVSYVFEVVDLLTKDNFSDRLTFNVLRKFLAELAGPAIDATGVLLAVNKVVFELLTLSGYRPVLRAESQGALLDFLNLELKKDVEREVQSFAWLKAGFSAKNL